MRHLDAAEPTRFDDMKTSRKIRLSPLLTAAALTLASCGGGSGGGGGDDNNIASPSLRSVGEQIFFDTNLSRESDQSCGSCHDPLSGFADPAVSAANPVSEGSVNGRFGNRNAPTSAYASLIPTFQLDPTTTVDGTTSNYRGGQFLDGRRSTLAEQARDPFLNPVEMDNIDQADVVGKVQNSSYADDFRTVFGANAFDNVSRAYDNIADAIAAFESASAMNPFSSKFDAFMAGRPGVSFTPEEQRGFDLFKGTKAKCANCHTVDSPAAGSLFTDFHYYNIATPGNPNNPANPFTDIGLGGNMLIADPVLRDAERGKFRTPTLRNVELTAPYMHNGAYQTLEDVILHYDILATDDLLFQAEVENDIAVEINYHSNSGLGLTNQERSDLEDFLKTLTDGFF
jgi:cytochrome c peroxidase